MRLLSRVWIVQVAQFRGRAQTFFALLLHDHMPLRLAASLPLQSGLATPFFLRWISAFQVLVRKLVWHSVLLY